MESSGKGPVCVTGGTGFLASWLIMKLLERGYTVNTTIRSSSPANKSNDFLLCMIEKKKKDKCMEEKTNCRKINKIGLTLPNFCRLVELADSKRDISFLTDLPGSSERLQIFNSDLDNPCSFGPAIEGCIGVFHVAHPMVFKGEETEEESIRKAVNGTLEILQLCLNAKTVKRVVYTSSIASVLYPKNQDNIVDESTWSDVDYIRSSNVKYGSSYLICKTLTEKACLDFAEKHGLDVISVLPGWISGPFITPNVPGTVDRSMVMISGGEDTYVASNIPYVHLDDVSRAHIFLFEHPEAKGRYICSPIEITVSDLVKFLSARYPEYQISSLDSPEKIERVKWPTVSSKKLLETGFKFNYGLEEIYDDAIRCYKEKSFL